MVDGIDQNEFDDDDAPADDEEIVPDDEQPEYDVPEPPTGADQG